ncbi:opioid growth factor receptor-related protein [Paludisphaera mucosa]|uniref:Opioid growth factor receptor-related protein n=1 Tax=Paludisphaera mucosa TaxID=3030827 RepID=A0ABT6FDT2_9BACT|nr:opioid growth factor receptor-related protein [Paludisphaera mucosa]MDG3005731.1 opioid growth factor receptor-related protein [Paludisphaera mucosa]
MSQLVEFYRGTGRDAEGRTLADVWAFSDDEMEFHHDFIQWLFPLEVPSQFNFRAPVLSEEDVAAFHEEPALRENLLRSFDRFLAFLGLKREDGRVVPAADFEAKRQVFLAPDHNWLRITRVLTSLRRLGLAEPSQAFYAGLLELMECGRARITADTRRYWKDATFPEEAD